MSTADPNVFAIINNCLLKTEQYTDLQIASGWNTFIAARYMASCENLVFEAAALSRWSPPNAAAHAAVYAALPKVILGRGERLPLFYPKDRSEGDKITEAMVGVYSVSKQVASRWAVLAAKDKSFEQDTLFRAGDDADLRQVQKPSKGKGK